MIRSTKALSDDHVKVEGFVKDRHWKMVPDDAFPVNVGVHATLMNAADHYRRVHWNPILSWNMYTRCLSMAGRHPGEAQGQHPPSLSHYSHSVGGIGWMSENFSRSVCLHILAPEDRSFYPFVGGYCWNAASTAMFHLVTLQEGRVSPRLGAFRYFLGQVKGDKALTESAERLHHYRECTDAALPSAREQFNAAGRVLAHISGVFLRRYPVGRCKEVPALGEIKSRALYEGALAKLGSERDSPKVIEFFREVDTADYYGSTEAALEKVASMAGGASLSPKETFEFLRDWSKRPSGLDLVRLWDKTSIQRRMLSHDYASWRGEGSTESALFGWEDGVQSLLQRLHEVYIELDGEGEELARLSELSLAIAEEQAEGWVVEGSAASPQDFQQTTRRLGEMLRAHVPLNKPY